MGKNKKRKKDMVTVTYLEDVKNEDISSDQDVQRAFCSDNEFVNEICWSVFKEDYIPPLIIGEIPQENGTIQSYIIDGVQRTTALMMFRHMNYKLAKTMEETVLKYQKKCRDKNGKLIRDEDGNIKMEMCEFNVVGKTFDDFPPELQQIFDRYQLELVVYENCDMEDISRLIRKFNKQGGMKVNQKALTWIPSFARKVKNIVKNNGFYKDCIPCSPAASKNGTYEQTVLDSIFTVFHRDEWKKQAKQRNMFLESNTSNDEVYTINEYGKRIHEVCLDEYQDIFTPKNIHVWFAVFHEFNSYGFEDRKFEEFLKEFRETLHSKTVNDITYDELDSSKNTKDKKTIIDKVDLICKLMRECFHVEDEDLDTTENILDFVKENVDDTVADEDVELCEDMFESYTIELDHKLKPFEDENKKSMLALIMYSMNQNRDTEMETFLPKYIQKVNGYSKNQKRNYKIMQMQFDYYVTKLEEKKSTGENSNVIQMPLQLPAMA